MKRLVIRAPNWLGDAVMALPAMAAVRARFADAHVAVAAIPSIAPLFEEETSAAPDSVVTLADRDAEMAALRDGGFDAILLFPNSFRSALTARRAGIAERWGYGAGLRRLLLTRAVARPAAGGTSRTTTVNWSRGWAFRPRSRSPASSRARQRWRAPTRSWRATASAHP